MIPTSADDEPARNNTLRAVRVAFAARTALFLFCFPIYSVFRSVLLSGSACILCRSRRQRLRFAASVAPCRFLRCYVAFGRRLPAFSVFCRQSSSAMRRPHAGVRRFFCFVRLFSPFIASKYWCNVPKRKNKNKESGEKIMKVRYGRSDHTSETGRADFYSGFFPCPDDPPHEHRISRIAIALPSDPSLSCRVSDGPQTTLFYMLRPRRKSRRRFAVPKGGGMSENVAFACTKVEHEFFNPDSFCPCWVVN